MKTSYVIWDIVLTLVVIGCIVWLVFIEAGSYSHPRGSWWSANNGSISVVLLWLASMISILSLKGALYIEDKDLKEILGVISAAIGGLVLLISVFAFFGLLTSDTFVPGERSGTLQMLAATLIGGVASGMVIPSWIKFFREVLKFPHERYFAFRSATPSEKQEEESEESSEDAPVTETENGHSTA